MNTTHTSKFAFRLAVAMAGVCAANAADYPRVILAQHPAAYYRLDEPPGATVARDLSPAHANATVNPGASATGATAQAAAMLPGISTNSAVFSGGLNSASITIPFSAALSPVNSDGLTGAPFSCECWVRPATAVPASPMCLLSVAGVAIGGSYANGSGWDFSEAGNPATWHLTMRSQQGAADLTGSTAVTAAQWNHLAVTWDGATATFFLNGVASESKAVPGYLAVPNFAGTIGAGPNTGGGAFEGAMAELVFYTNAVDPITISNHFAVGHAILGTALSTAPPPTTP
jgi:hypothetical protein